jgi:hypothetical protein
MILKHLVVPQHPIVARRYAAAEQCGGKSAVQLRAGVEADVALDT